MVVAEYAASFINSSVADAATCCYDENDRLVAAPSS